MTAIQIATQRLAPQGLIVDHFAGGGGASTGVMLALGVGPDIAINHSEKAIAIHAVNHPETRHYQESVWDVDPEEATGGQAVSLMWMSPSCTHFSKAKGGAPLDRRIRGLAWVGVRWAIATEPDVIVCENVTEFLSWGPLKDGRPDPMRKGETFLEWVAALKRAGYTVAWRVLDAADYGAPTHRTRLFIIARRDGRPITFPQPTHGPGCAHPHVPVSAVLDWSDAGTPVTPARKLSDTTRTKITRVLDELGETAPNGRTAAIVQYNGQSLGRRISRPLGTLTTVERFGLAQLDDDGVVTYRMLTVSEMLCAQGFPVTYLVPGGKNAAVAMIGNSVSPMVAAAVVREVTA